MADDNNNNTPGNLPPDSNDKGNTTDTSAQGTASGPKVPGIRNIGARKKRIGITTQTTMGNKIAKKWMVVGGISLVIIVAGATLLAPHHAPPPKPKAQVRTVSIVPQAIGNASFDKNTESSLERMRQKYLAIQHNQIALAKLVHKGEATQKQMADLIAAQDAKIAAQQRLLKEQSAAQQKHEMLPPPPPPPTINNSVPPPMAPPPLEVPANESGIAPPGSPPTTNTREENNQFGVVLSPSSETSALMSGAKMAYSIEKNPYAGYIPAGSFLPAVLLTGIDANTASSSQGNPEPVLMRIQRTAIIPNGGHYNLSGCFAIGSATGSISSRRADIRLTTISCTNQKHDMVLQAPIKGYAVDSDGKFGLRGKLIQREGSILEKSLLAGFASGLGSAMQGGLGTSYSGSLGTGTSISGMGNSLGSGALDGAGDAMNQLAQFYLNQAKNIFPVIEVPPGRKITLVLVKGSRFAWHKANSKYILVKHPVKLLTPVNNQTHKEAN